MIYKLPILCSWQIFLKNVPPFLSHHCKFSLHSTNYMRRIPSYNPSVPRTVEEEQKMLNRDSFMSLDTKLLKIAIIGPPNSGKSTLINNLMGWKICCTSSKVHTTTFNSSAVLTEGCTQLIFLDTPGMVTSEEVKKYRLKQSLISGPEESLQMADLIVILHDVSNHFTRNVLHPLSLRLLSLYPQIPSILVLNKVDKLKNKKLLLNLTKNLTCNKKEFSSMEIPQAEIDLIGKNFPEEKMELISNSPSKVSIQEQPHDTHLPDFSTEKADSSLTESLGAELMRGITDEDVYQGRTKLTEVQSHFFIKNKIGWPKFQDVFMVSALKGMGIMDLKKYLLTNASPSPWTFSGDVVTDQSPQDIALYTIREKCLENLKNNIPYELKFKIDFWELSDAEVLDLVISIHCKNKSHMKLIIGPRGQNIQFIALQAETQLRSTFRSEVKLLLLCKLIKMKKKK